MIERKYIFQVRDMQDIGLTILFNWLDCRDYPLGISGKAKEYRAGI